MNDEPSGVALETYPIQNSQGLYTIVKLTRSSVGKVAVALLRETQTYFAWHGPGITGAVRVKVICESETRTTPS